ncbi:MAG: hypothetical protein ABIH23_03035, partial [bacterium]
MRPSFLLPVLVLLVAGLILAVVVFLPSGGNPDRPESGEPSPKPTAVLDTSVRESASPTGGPASSGGMEGQGVAEGGIAETTGSVSADDTESEAATGAVGAERDNAAGGESETTQKPESDSEKPPSSDGTIAGAVYSGRRIPLAGVIVQAGGKSATSDNNGRFALDGIQGSKVDVVASLNGHQTVTKKKVAVGTKDLSIILIQDNHLAGRVVDQYGKPVSFASVRLNALKGIWMLSLESDISGSFETDNVPDAQIQITATREGLTDTGGGTVVVDAPHPEIVLLRLQRPSFSIRGSVRMAETGQGVANFALTALKQDEEGTEPLQAVTSGGGDFRFDELDVGVYLVGSNAAENQGLGVAIPLHEDKKTVRIFDKNAENVIFVALPGFTVSGWVIGSDGAGVSGARVTLAQQSAFSRTSTTAQSQIGTMSGSDGRYQLQGIPWSGGSGSVEAQLFASHLQYGSGMSEVFSVDPAARSVQDINITLTGSVSLSGYVVSAQGQ